MGKIHRQQSSTHLVLPAEITLIIPRKVDGEFKRLAKKAWPIELPGVLLGTHAWDTIHVDEIWIPDDWKNWCTEDAVKFPMEWLNEAEEEGEVVGWIHSHPYTEIGCNMLLERTQSEGDYAHPCQSLPIKGICVVQQVKNGSCKSLRASSKYWGPITRLETQLI